MKQSVNSIICITLLLSLMLLICDTQAQLVPIPTISPPLDSQRLVRVDFNFTFYDLYGIKTDDLYSGGWFNYNITLTNIGNSEINATYKVTVLNPDNTINGNSRDFPVNLTIQQTSFLYANNTLFAPNSTLYSPYNTDAHFADIAGAYKVNITANEPMIFCRYASNNSSYNYSPYSYKISFDAMPSYQEKINQQTSDFYNTNLGYFNNFTDYIDSFNEYAVKADEGASQAQTLSYITIILSIMALFISCFSISKEERWSRMAVYMYTIFGLLISGMFLFILPQNWGLLTIVAYGIFGIVLLTKFIKTQRGNHYEEEQIKKKQNEYTS